MKKATIDPSKRLDIYLRISRNGSITFTFLDSNGDAYNVSDFDFELFIKQNAGSRKDVISLLTSYAGFGLTFQSSNQIKATFTDTITDLNEGEYYWELLLLDTNKTWLNGKAFFYNGEFDGVENSEDITIDVDGSSITITLDGDNALASNVRGSTGSTDNAILRADVNGGNTLQNSSVTISDDGIVTIPNGGLIRGLNNASLVGVQSASVGTEDRGSGTVGDVYVTGGSVSGTATRASDVYIYGGSTAVNGVNAGSVFIMGGDSLGTGKMGNVALTFSGAALIDFKSMQRGIYIEESIAIPTDNTDGGVFLYVEGGLLKSRGPSGEHYTIKHPFIRVDDHGAVGDGIVDDTDAIQSAVNEAGIKGTVYFSPNRTYIVSGELSVATYYGQTWIGHGATIKRISDAVMKTTTTGTVASGATSIPVLVPSYFSIGDSVILCDITSTYLGTGETEVSQTLTITNIVGSTITVDDGVDLPSNGNLGASYPIGTMLLKVFNMVNGASSGLAESTPMTLIGLTFDGNIDNNTSYRGWVNNGTFRNVPYYTVFDTCNFYNMPCENVFPNVGQRFSKCTASNLGGSFIHVSSDIFDGGVILSQCNVQETCLTPFAISQHNEGIVTYSARATKIIIEGGQYLDCDGALAAPMSADQFPDDYIIINGVYCENLKGVIKANSDPLNLEPVYKNIGVKIHNSHFINCDYVDFTTSTDGAIYFGGGHDNITIGGNSFTDTRFRFRGCSRLSFTGNNILFNDGFVAVATSIPVDADHANAVTFADCVDVAMTGNNIFNAATTISSTLTRGILLNHSTIRINTAAATPSNYLYGMRNFLVSSNTINGFDCLIKDFGSGFTTSTRAQYSAVNCRVNGNVLTQHQSSTDMAAECCAGTVWQGNTIYCPSTSLRGVRVSGVRLARDGDLNGGIFVHNTIIGAAESIEVGANAGTDFYNAQVLNNIVDGTVDDMSSGNSTISGTITLVNETVLIKNARQNPDFY